MFINLQVFFVSLISFSSISAIFQIGTLCPIASDKEAIVLNKFTVLLHTLISVEEFASDNNGTLFICDKTITSIGEKVFRNIKLSNLTLYLADQEVSLFPDSFADLSDLNVLEFISGKIKLDPEIFRELINLEYLGIILVDGPSQNLQDKFHRLVNLKTLKISKSNLKIISSKFFMDSGLKNLQVLDLENNGIESIEPKAFVVDGIKTMETLKLNKNQLKFIGPDAFSGLYNLKTLEIQENKMIFIAIGYFNSIPNLEILNLAFNEINHIESGAFKNSIITDLFLEHNKIISLAEGALEGAKHLKLLDLSHNLMTIIQTNIYNVIKSLKYLNFKGNNCTTIEKNAFYGLELIKLDLSKNQLLIIESYFFNGLNCNLLKLDKNPVVAIANDAFKNTKGSTIAIRDTQLPTIYKTQWGLCGFTTIT